MARGATPPNVNTPSGIGIQLLDAPVSRRADPRANEYIIDFLAPGTTINRRVLVSNTTTTAKKVQVYAAAATIDNGAFVFGDGHAVNELVSWVSVDHTDLYLLPNTDIPVLVTIRVPKTASAGERYAVVWAQTAAMPSGARTIGAVNRVGVRIYLDIGPGGEPASDFQIETLTPARTPDGRPQISAQVRNTGGRAVDLNGTLTLANGPGSLNAGPYDLTSVATLAPGEVAPVVVVLDRQLPDGPWHVHLTIVSGFLTRTADAVITFPDTGTGAPVVALLTAAQHSPPSGTQLLLLVVLACGAILAAGVFELHRRPAAAMAKKHNRK